MPVLIPGKDSALPSVASAWVFWLASKSIMPRESKASTLRAVIVVASAGGADLAISSRWSLARLDQGSATVSAHTLR